MESTAQETLQILDRGWYDTAAGRVGITEAQAAAVAHTVLIRPDDFLGQVSGARPARKQGNTRYAVTPETTQAAARRLVQDEGVADLAALNFASARNVGGGFLQGARAQEEDIARSSGLFRCLETQPEYYQANRDCGSFLYTDHVIHSPAVPWFRGEERRLLPEPFLASIISAPAPNAREYLRRQRGDRSALHDALERRVARILEVALAMGHANLLLGAWGCGAFGNDAQEVASIFMSHLRARRFRGRFEQVVFAVYDPTESGITYKTFRAAVPRTGGSS